MYIPDFPYHIVQRGNNREPCFLATDDYRIYLDLLANSLTRYEVQLHAYVLMTNHVHLLMTPACVDSISRIMKVVASRYAYTLNKTHGRTGTIWEGRHKAGIVQAEKYLLACYRYIELNPVAARMVEYPEQYRWSSHGANAWGDACEWITPHSGYLALGDTTKQRLLNYRQLFQLCEHNDESAEIRKATRYCQPLGDEGFRELVESKIKRSVGQIGRGRPRTNRREENN
jgi:putative transposase